jgi:acyl phosphate:glycerol-3-phosphate acyltransferase
MDIHEPAVIVLILLGAYLSGSVPFALLLGFLLRKDIRKIGSGNPGATNLARAAGRGWGITAFILDFAKGLLPVLAARWLEEAGEARLFHWTGMVQTAAGLAAILGHVFPVWLRFRGGKGVATTFGVMAGLSTAATVLAGAVWAVVYLVSRTVSLASIAAALALPAGVLLLERAGDRFLVLLAFSAAVALLIIIRHRSNIARLLRGEELRFGGHR